MGNDDRGWDWAGRGTSHIEFSREEIVPLDAGRLLGHGMNGPVHEAVCNGKEVAWKEIFCPNRITSQYRKDIETIKKLKHCHIIELVGTYTKGPYLGLLLWPVAICDLAALLDDIDYLKARSFGRPCANTNIDERALRRRAITLGCPDWTMYTDLTPRLKRCPMCITAAVAFLHEQGIKHKYLKPSNILLFPNNGLRITDFGSSSDLSGLDNSVTSGTPKYSAPEVAICNPSGRAADIFSLGCILFEIILMAYTQVLWIDLKKMRSQHDHSFQANLQTAEETIRTLDYAESLECQHLFCVVSPMLQRDPDSRPSIGSVFKGLDCINEFNKQEFYYPHDFLRAEKSCCSPHSNDFTPTTSTERAYFPFSITFAVHSTPGGRFNQWGVTINARSSEDYILGNVTIFSHPGSTPCADSHSTAPFESKMIVVGSHIVSVQLTLKRNFRWVRNMSPYRPTLTRLGESVTTVAWILEPKKQIDLHCYAFLVEGPLRPEQPAAELPLLPTTTSGQLLGRHRRRMGY